MKLELYLHSDVAIGGESQKAGTVVGKFDTPFDVRGDRVAAKLSSLVARGVLRFREPEIAEPAKPAAKAPAKTPDKTTADAKGGGS